ncbi:hypothetical protein [Yinghuangia seranimata]|uniref:hypothetical protein n=1 Tax=Yinghuangia seranimata TaxID=408067 RepID=UPI00248C8A4D|nr:hypothetical protein [Yinghuangia seranimata]MDI2126737.1 hypothetical protein [Yinghuangia seranimata]
MRDLRAVVGGAAGAVAAQFDAATRARRWELFREAFPDIERLAVVDLGGTPEFWLHAPVRPARVEVVRADAKPQRVLGWLAVAVGEPAAFGSPGDEGTAYDLAVCDGLLDATPPGARGALARTVRGLAPRYWVRSEEARPAELAGLFPDAVRRRERRGGLTCSWVAAKPG